MNEKIFHPAPYIDRQVAPALRSNDLTKEVVWTYLVAIKYADNQSSLVKLLCGIEEELPDDSRIWLEAYLHPTRKRKEEKNFWKSRADLSVGHLELVKGRDSQIQSCGDWVCIVESKWYDDIHQNSKFPDILQLSQLIEHAILMHDSSGKFPERVYVTLLTPNYFRENKGPFSDRQYKEKYNKYKISTSYLKEDLKLCNLAFFEYDLDTLLERIDSLILRWVTFEEVLGLPELVGPQVPGKYKINMISWKQIFKKIGMADVYEKLVQTG